MKTYRPDIDGLRCVAVSLVILFHAFPQKLKGGFVGVDIFFVISGYLISGIVFKELDQGIFSVSRFYLRRIRRIFPALIVVLLLGFVAGIFIDSSYVGYQNYLKQATAASAFYVNIQMMHETGYFSPVADKQPLLHIWSLSIEEQYYLIWPVVILIIWHFRNVFYAVSALVFSLSLAYSVFLSGSDANGAFYSLSSRVWEFLVGGCIAYFDRAPQITIRKFRNTLAFLGILCLIASQILISSDKIYPYFWALLPVGAAGCFLLAGESAWINRKLLAWKPIVFLGLISYPLYLTHWPLFYFLRQKGTDTTENKLMGILVCVLVSWIIFKFIERPIRQNASDKRIALALLLAMGMVFGGSVVARRVDLTVYRYQADIREPMRQLNRLESLNDMAKLYGEKTCFIYDRKFDYTIFQKNGCLDIRYSGRPTVLLWGDSHAASLALGLKQELEKSHINLLEVTAGWCEPTVDNESYGPYEWCDNINAVAMEKISKLKPELVLLHAWWTRAAMHYYHGKKPFNEHLAGLIRRILRAGAGQVVVIGPVPALTGHLPRIMKDYLISGTAIPERLKIEIAPDSLENDQQMRRINWPQGTSYFSITDVLCDGRGCKASVCNQDLEVCALMWDYSHLTKAAAAEVSRALLSRYAGQLYADKRNTR